MINILIIEDNENDRRILKDLISDFLEAVYIEYKIKWSKSIINDMNLFYNFDILFLDIEIGDENGIDYAKKIRESHPDILMIIISNYPQYLIDGYTIEAKRYFLKPIDKTTFEIEMKNVLLTSFKQSFGFYDPKISRGKIKYYQIYYVEFLDRVSNIHLFNNTILKTPYSLKHWIEILSDKGFSQPYRSFIVNLNYVSGFTSDGRDIILINNEKIPLSKNYKKSFEEEYYKYLSRLM